jgi:hypothetical protein
MGSYLHRGRNGRQRATDRRFAFIAPPPGRAAAPGYLHRLGRRFLSIHALPFWFYANLVPIACVFGGGKIGIVTVVGSFALWMTVVLPVYLAFWCRDAPGEALPREGMRSPAVIMAASIAASQWLIAIVAWGAGLH